jgi:hypothetical protein
VPEHVASRAILQLAHPADTVLGEVGRLAAAMPVRPVSVVVFGSLARREGHVVHGAPLPDLLSRAAGGWRLRGWGRRR